MGHHDEGPASGDIYPGQAIRLQSDGSYLQETLAPATKGPVGLKVAKEPVTPGSPYLTPAPRGTVGSKYASGDNVFFYSPLPGDHLNVLVDTGENVAVGDMISAKGTGNGNFGATALIAGARQVPVTSWRAPTNINTVLGAATATILGLITGTVGTATPMLQSDDSKAASHTAKAIAEYNLPADYIAGGTFSLAIKAGMITTVADTSATLTVEVFRDAGDGTVGANIGPAAQSINSLAAAVKTFVITPTTLNPGDKLILRLTTTIVDGASGTAVIAQIENIKAQTNVSVGAQLEVLESSGGVLAAATLLRARVLVA